MFGILAIINFFVNFTILKILRYILTTFISTLYYLFPWLENNVFFHKIMKHSPIRLDHYIEEKELTHISILAEENNMTIHTHYCFTEDGFILCLHHLISNENKLLSNKNNKIPIIFFHGLMKDSESFMCCEDKSYAIILAKLGYDIWLANNRGNRYSHGHLTLNPETEKYWDFCIDDMARHDVPTILQYVLKHTIHNKVIIIGFSQGCSQIFCSLSLFPNFNNNIVLFISLAPAVQALNDNYAAQFAESNPFFINLILGNLSFFPGIQIWRRLLHPKLFYYFMKLNMLITFNWKFSLISSNRLIKLAQHAHSYCSVKNIIHWLQIINYKKLCMFKSKSTFFSSFTPRKKLPYDLSIVTCPVAVFAGEKDGLINPYAVKDNIKSCFFTKIIPEYQHMELLWSDDVDIFIIPDLKELVSKYGQIVNKDNDDDQNEKF